VFSSFSLLYLAIAYYILPAIAITLKIRQRKTQTSSFTDGALSDIALSSSEQFIETLPNCHLGESSIAPKLFSTGKQSIEAIVTEQTTISSFSRKLLAKTTAITLYRA